MDRKPSVLSVGQCGPDHGSLTHWLSRSFGASTTGADTHREALRLLQDRGFDLVLVNRIGDLDGAPGLDLIRAIKAEPALAGLPVMLVSNYESAQSQAVELGAIPGFGKSELGTHKALDMVRNALSLKEVV